MKERSIIFSAPMVRAILEGRKTQTRRIIRQQPPFHPDGRWSFIASSTDRRERGMFRYAWPDPEGNSYSIRGRETSVCLRPICRTGDRLWVRETWMHSNWPDGPAEPDCAIFYRADYLDDPLGPDLERSPDGIRRKWLPSIHMPRWASRITLEVTGVRVEQLQDISEADAIAEGLEQSKYGYSYAPDQGTWFSNPPFAFRDLWGSINGTDSWAANPWVWVIEFKRVEGGQ